MTSSPMELAWGGASDVGLRRKENQDSYLAEPPLFLVADGMGGHAAGRDASSRAIAAFSPLLNRNAVTIKDLEASFTVATSSVAEIPDDGAPAGTTLSGVTIANLGEVTYWLIINIGDSRTYRFAAGNLEQISVDHSAVQELIDSGSISTSEAENHPYRNVITRAIGAGSESEPDYWMIPAETGDRVLVCSDGLTKEITDEHIARVLRSEVSPQAAAVRLVHEALLRGGEDNVTVVVVDAVRIASSEEHHTVPGTAPDDETDDHTVPRSRTYEPDAETGAGDASIQPR